MFKYSSKQILSYLMSFRPRDPTLMELEPFQQNRIGSDRTLWDFQAAPPFFIQRTQRVERPTNSRPQFRAKAVCILDCKHCELEVCRRGMKAILLADMNVLILIGRAIFYRCTTVLCTIGK